MEMRALCEEVSGSRSTSAARYWHTVVDQHPEDEMEPRDGGLEKKDIMNPMTTV
jgi:hypothetical protein